MIRCIADQLRELHISSKFCGNLLDNIFVHPSELTVTFPCIPNITLDKCEDCVHICDDSIQLRYLVAYLIRYTPKMYKNDILQPLPTNFLFFFSRIFIVGLNANDAPTILEHSFYQLYHDVTFDSLDKIRFIQSIMDYKNYDATHFEKFLDLDDEAYMLQDWLTYFPRSYNLYPIVDSTLFYDLNPSKDPNKRQTADYHCSSMPCFICNVHYNYTKYEKTMTHQKIEKLFNNKFLAICSKILDAKFRCFNEEVGPFRFKLAT
jgi:hypothetical protein